MTRWEQKTLKNTTLSQIIKLQNTLLMVVFRNYMEKHKGIFYELSTEKSLSNIENALYKDQKFRNALKDQIIARFTVEEYKDYT